MSKAAAIYLAIATLFLGVYIGMGVAVAIDLGGRDTKRVAKASEGPTEETMEQWVAKKTAEKEPCDQKGWESGGIIGWKSWEVECIDGHRVYTDTSKKGQDAERSEVLSPDEQVFLNKPVPTPRKRAASKPYVTQVPLPPATTHTNTHICNPGMEDCSKVGAWQPTSVPVPILCPPLGDDLRVHKEGDVVKAFGGHSYICSKVRNWLPIVPADEASCKAAGGEWDGYASNDFVDGKEVVKEKYWCAFWPPDVAH